MSKSSISQCAFVDSLPRFPTNVLATLMLPWEIQPNQIKKNANKPRVHNTGIPLRSTYRSLIPHCSFAQEAPVVARAALFLECARFVHRCNRGNWPEWMKGHHVNITKKGLSRGRSPIVGNKRNQKLQWNAAKLFYQWGDVSFSFSSIKKKIRVLE